jgi:hypothetical protein
MARYETAPYKVMRKEGHFEIRQYDAFYTAGVEESSLEGSGGFRQIFDYISGSNEEQKKISMTTPVINELRKESVSTEFVMPSTFTEDTLPEPSNPRVKIRKTERRLTASVTFSGTTSRKKIMEYEKRLLAWIEKKNMKPTGNFRLARYNPPFIPPFLRRNEIIIDIVTRGADGSATV